MTELRLRSYAKINLSLKIKGIREDRFHEIDSIMQSVSLYDEIVLKELADGIEIVSDDPGVPKGEGNLAYKAAKAFFDFTKNPLRASIKIKKNIPVAAGLAGASGNAAATLTGLDTLFNTRLSKVQLSSLGADVGSDVPFCLIGGRCRVRGRGEIVEELPILPKMWFVLVAPDVSVSTKWAYEEYDRWSLRVRGGLKPRPSPSLEPPSEIMHNDFEEAISEKFPIIAEIKRKLLKAGAISASMSGSGPSVFGMASDEVKAYEICKKMKSEFPRVFVVSSVNYGIKVI